MVTAIVALCVDPPSPSLNDTVNVRLVTGSFELLAKVRFSITRSAIAGVTLMVLASRFHVITKLASEVPPAHVPIVSQVAPVYRCTLLPDRLISPLAGVTDALGNDTVSLAANPLTVNVPPL